MLVLAVSALPAVVRPRKLTARLAWFAVAGGSPTPVRGESIFGLPANFLIDPRCRVRAGAVSDCPALLLDFGRGRRPALLGLHSHAVKEVLGYS